MFNAKLYKFQETHVESLLRKCADHEEMVLCAPTGSGKTVMVSKFIDDYLDEIQTLYSCGFAPELVDFKSSQKKALVRTRVEYLMAMYIAS